MAVKSVYDSQDDVPEDLRDHYVEKDGKWVLQVEGGVQTHPDAVAVKRALDAERANVRKLKGELQTANEKLAGVPEDFDPDEYLQLKSELEALKTADPERQKALGKEHLDRQKAMYEQRIADIEKKHEKKVKELEEKVAKSDKDLADVIVEDGLTKALVEAGVGKEYLRASKALLKENVKVVRDEGEKPRAVIEIDGVEDSLESFVKNWVQSDEGKPFVPKGTGGGSEGSSKQKSIGFNPWDDKTHNITKQQEIISTNPARAKELAAAAGKTIPESAFKNAA